MIRSFKDIDTERVFQEESVRKFQSFERVALRKLLFLRRAKTLRDMKGPGFELEALKRDRAGQYAIHITKKSRLCFIWRDGVAYDVEIVINYH
ncbi:MAG: type II toxin-antitoxin system RelE/ParE family toxin [Candidatus Eremiobacteraeota bacterium]|nr:type II toxin-antitoxin system RelE/ParE family toxin [Candidatus Eremiobacteraeota bacterium]